MSANHAPRILLALTSHGLGHLTRSLEIARELRDLHRGIEWIVATTVPEARVALGLPPPFRYRPVGYEPGTLQKTCFELDREGTRTAYQRFIGERRRRLAEETAFLRQSGCSAVVSDVPALPIAAAAALGLPAIGVANFTWDWILEPLLAGGATDAIPGQLAADYASGLAHLRLPFGPETSPFPASEPAPLVSRHARSEPETTRAQLAVQRDGRKLVLVCPGGWSSDDWSPIHVPGGADFRFVTVGDLPVSADAPLIALPHDLPPGLAFPDLVAAADVVLAKPGYGIASECWLHRTPLVSIERPDFRETELLEEQFARIGPAARLRLAPFFAGDWQGALVRALSAPTAWVDPPAGGARRVARRLAELLGLEPRADTKGSAESG